MQEQKQDKKYVVVLAHADGWGAQSANKVVKAIHKKYPEVGIYLVVSQATKNKEGEILTKIDDLKLLRELKETNLLEYFRRIDEHYDEMAKTKRTVQELYRSGENPFPDMSPADAAEHMYQLGVKMARAKDAEMLTFKQLAKRYCTDGEVHYTDTGGFKGGEQVAGIIDALEAKHGKGTEVLLSVDTMAILPEKLLEKYQCFSTHPGPMDTVKIEGMQGTLRALTQHVLYDQSGKLLYDEEGAPLDPNSLGHRLGMPSAFVKGTLFLQHPILDKGPPIASLLSPTIMGMCAYQTRDDLYYALTDKMLELLPDLLDKDKRSVLVEKATREKEELDKLPHRVVEKLDESQLESWESKAIAVPGDTMPHGLDLVKNMLVDPRYFENQMREYFPGPEEEFEKTFKAVFGATIEKLEQQSRQRLPIYDPAQPDKPFHSWMTFVEGSTPITIRHHDPKTGEVTREFSNRSGETQR